MRCMMAVAAGRVTRLGLRLFGRGATTLPGLVAETICPSILMQLGSRCGQKIVVSGTNGKTSTTRLVSGILNWAGQRVVTNRAGSNLTRGLVTALLEQSDLAGRTGVFEVDERALPKVIDELRPSIVVLPNLFRDQLDRHGEIDSIVAAWSSALACLPEEATVVANADDPQIAYLATECGKKTLFYGIEDVTQALSALPRVADATQCPRCWRPLTFLSSFLSHLGHYVCETCGFNRPLPGVAGCGIELRGVVGSKIMVGTQGNEGCDVESRYVGLYGAYNVLAAMAVAHLMGIPLQTASAAVVQEPVAFGRSERFMVDGKLVFLSLVKNPAGFDAVVRAVVSGHDERTAVLAINDGVADGRDVSWLWDVDVNVLGGRMKKVWLTGTRANDMAVRLQYSGVGCEMVVEENIGRAVVQALRETSEGSTLCVLPTYTALLEVNKVFAGMGLGRRYWDD